MQNDYELIKKDKLIWKFSFYGLLKNLKFFEPYLIIFLLGLNYSLFTIGLLYSVREIITYIFEIPSGIIADNYGKKKELMICFVFYIISFILFFIGSNIYIVASAFIFYGLGEAFRSGTHKAMIYSYLERKDWFHHKTYVYGRTRSFSLLGSSLSAFVSIIFVFNIPSLRWIFLICILPYIADFFLIFSYPNYLNEKVKNEFNLSDFFKESAGSIKSIFKNNKLRVILISSSFYDAIFKSIKDYIQPILKVIIIGSFITSDINIKDAKLKIYLGIIYGIFYIVSSFASKNVYRITNKINSTRLMELSFDLMGILSLIIFFGMKMNSLLFVVAVFFILYVLKDSRRPIFVDVCGDNMKKTERATVLSIDSQIKSLFVIILAPLFGFIADNYSINILFLIIGIFILVFNRFLKIDKR
ncbi:MFS transporter [Helicovermis profundi]|uniref:MFS transporter n=1 Tax=Helicovermis profundi TaxID=3065157 RepID=A0AAU9E0C2_9FIRM|nr:MFS transporter [Clostridia bacterium S502]